MDDCIEYQGSRSWNGYGQVGRRSKVDGKSRPVGAHRAAWEKVHGPIPKGMVICHTCDNRACINVDHLWMGTQRDNLLDMYAKGRQNIMNRVRGADHCCAKLTENNVHEIRRLFKAGIAKREIARRFKVSHQNIRSIINKESWRWLVDDTLEIGEPLQIEVE